MKRFQTDVATKSAALVASGCKALVKHEATHHSAITGGARAVHAANRSLSGDLHAPPDNMTHSHRVNVVVQ